MCPTEGQGRIRVPPTSKVTALIWAGNFTSNRIQNDHEWKRRNINQGAEVEGTVDGSTLSSNDDSRSSVVGTRVRVDSSPFVVLPLWIGICVNLERANEERQFVSRLFDLLGGRFPRAVTRAGFNADQHWLLTGLAFLQT